MTAIYLREATIRFTLVTTNAIIYTDSITDPYSTQTFPTGSTTLNENQTAIDAQILPANYDMGHVFNAGWNGGLAQLSAVCTLTGKARAASGLQTNFGGPTGSVFESVVAHEMAHNFSARHTHSASNTPCGGGNLSLTTAYEPGGGSTIMAYAACTGNSYQNNSDRYFHAHSVAQITTFAAITTCATPTSSGNTAPTITSPTAATAYNIPHSTPFQLTLVATDPNGDPMTYSWEQMDLPAAGMAAAPTGTQTTGPNFRVFPPSTSNVRYLPNLPALTAGTATPYEVLPTIARTLNFRGTIRDNRPSGGCTSERNITVNTQTCGPFSITSQNTATTLAANGTNTFTTTWNTASACTTCPNVTVSLSTDGGITYPHIIAASTANDGTEIFTVPNLPTCDGRIMIKCANNIFFDINNAAVTITSGCRANGGALSNTSPIQAAQGNSTLNLASAPQFGTAIANFSGSITTADPVSNLIYSSSGACSGPSNPNFYDFYTFTPSITGTYTFNNIGTSGLVGNLYKGVFNPSSLCSDWLASSGSLLGGSVNLASTVSASFCAGITYSLVVTSFNSSGTPVLPAVYAIGISPPAGGGLFNNTPPPTPVANFNYCYVVVNLATGRIAAVQSSPDLSNSATYPIGHFAVYGVSASSGTSCTALNTTYATTNFNAFKAAILNQTGGLCANLSTNFARVTVGNPPPLSVELLSFEAYLVEKKVYLNWVSQNEINNKYFTLEKSKDGVDYEFLANIDGLTNSSKPTEYQYIDEKAFAGKSYYRLSQTDLDGKQTRLAIRLIDNKTNQRIDLMPNPTKNMINFDLVNFEKGSLTITIENLAGQTVYEQSSTLDGSLKGSIDVSHLPKGIYVFRVLSNNSTAYSKLVLE